MSVTHLELLEAEAIQIMREVVAETEKPVMLYSIGKDSGAMLHLAKKAFYPTPPPLPLLHVRNPPRTARGRGHPDHAGGRRRDREARDALLDRQGQRRHAAPREEGLL